jgi:GMP synthase-like glutamine amidotransferase
MFLNWIIIIIILSSSNEVLSIQNIECESLGGFKDFLLSDGFKITEVLSPKQKIPSNIKNFDAIFILGGPMSANDGYEYLKKERQLVVDAIDLKIPVLGVCLGSQIIANSCGGKVYKGLRKEIGWGPVDITDVGKDSLFKGVVDRNIEVFQWHGDTFDLPNNTKILSCSDIYIQAFEYKTAFGIQFHLEVTKQMILDWIKEYHQEILKEKIKKQDLLFNIDNRVKELHKCSKIVYDNFKLLLK